VIFDCQSCGACCCNTDENRAERYVDYVEVTRRSALAQHPRLLRKLTVVNGKGERHMRLRGAEQRCAALEGRLGEHVACSIYELRPGACRTVKPGSRECRRDRRERGID
jgi:Fe-S-cluster containining protein